MFIPLSVFAVDVSIGTGDNDLCILPVHMCFKSSITETIYSSSDVNTNGSLTGISWYNTFMQSCMQKPIKIWVGETSQTNLSGGWIPSTDLSLVFEGFIDFPAGDNNIPVQFNTPYQYQGGNLVIMVLRQMDTQLYSESINRFYCSDGDVSCGRSYGNDTTEPDPTAPPVTMWIVSDYPNITLHFDDDQVYITGRVVSSFMPSAGVGGATITLSNVMTYTATTDSNGYFTFPSVMPDMTYAYTIFAPGYTPIAGTIAVSNVDMNMGTFMLPSVVEPASDVTATIIGNNAVINWEPPITDSIVAYNVYRLYANQSNNPETWTLLTTTPVDSSSYTDVGWSMLSPGEYLWAVIVVYPENVLSVPALSNHLLTTDVGIISGIVTAAQWPQSPIEGAAISVNGITAYTDASGAYSLIISCGTYSVTCWHADYTPVTENNIIVNMASTTTLNFQLNHSFPFFSDDFESYTDFATSFPVWTTLDLDVMTTYGIDGYSWPGSGQPQAFMVFNPSATTPPLDESLAHGGLKCAACFNSTFSVCNDWLISPRLYCSSASQLSFWARSYVSTYGLERFMVGISTTSNIPSSFSFIQGPTYIQAPVNWTLYDYDLSAYQGQNIYFCIKCISDNALLFLVDDINFYSWTGANDDQNAVPSVSKLIDNYPNPFNPNTTIKYSIRKESAVNITVYNTKGQKVRILVDGTIPAGEHVVLWDGNDMKGAPVSSGVYFYRMKAGAFNSTRKMILMK